MSPVIIFKDVSDDTIDNLSFEIAAGSSTLLIAANELEGDHILKLISGLRRPADGTIRVLDYRLDELPDSALYELRQDIGGVPFNGGMVSNLKFWENITLPLLYHTGSISDEVKESAFSLLKKLKYEGNIMALPAHLSLYEKRVAAFVRAALCTPEIMVYNCFDNLSAAQLRLLAGVMKEFHDEASGRTSLYIVSSVESARFLSVDNTLNVHESPAGTINRP